MSAKKIVDVLRRLDEDVGTLVALRSRWGRWLLGSVVHTGDLTFLAFVTGAWITAWMMTGALDVAALSAFLIRVVGSTIVVLAVKLVVQRERPHQHADVRVRLDPYSFPSGHAARSVALAIWVATSLPSHYGVLAVSWAMILCVGRIALQYHSASDVLGGILMGAALTPVFERLDQIHPWF